MNVEFINPFLEAVVNVLKTMASTEAVNGKPFLKDKDEPAEGDVTGVIGLTGPVNGSLALSFSEPAILEVVSNMFGESASEIDGEVCDAVGELTNMISGDARRKLEEKGHSFQAAIPTIIRGPNHKISHSIPGPTVVIPFTIGGDKAFFVETAFEGL